RTADRCLPGAHPGFSRFNLRSEQGRNAPIDQRGVIFLTLSGLHLVLPTRHGVYTTQPSHWLWPIPSHIEMEQHDAKRTR
ncbi:MAG: hypothetical protein AAGJ36_09330, partial [Pseudomonadota bacterium]